MTERLDSELVLDSTEVFIPNKELSLKKKGRKPIITSEKWLDAVKKIQTMNDKDIAKELKCGKTTVYYFRKNSKNIDVINEGIEFLKKLAEIGYNRKLDNWEIFKNIPIIKEWKSLMKNRRLKNKTINGWMHGLWRICKYLKKHPLKLTVDECAELNKWIRDLYYNGEKEDIPYGLNYQRTRESIRVFYMDIYNVSDKYLTNKGITKENLPTFGKYSKMTIPQDVRHKFEESLKKFVKDKNEYCDALNYCISAYATATRATALSEVELDNAIIFTNKEWVFKVVDKGGLKWDKIIVGHLLDKLRYGLSQRFNVPIDELELRLSKVTNRLFPLAYKDIIRLRELIKMSLIDAGLRYKEFPPIHIWRHTFAQDALRASNWNYELVASIGGWKSTKILKEVYGEIGLDIKIKGVKKMMGIKEKENNFELRW